MDLSNICSSSFTNATWFSTSRNNVEQTKGIQTKFELCTTKEASRFLAFPSSSAINGNSEWNKSKSCAFSPPNSLRSYLKSMRYCSRMKLEATMSNMLATVTLKILPSGFSHLIRQCVSPMNIHLPQCVTCVIMIHSIPRDKSNSLCLVLVRSHQRKICVSLLSHLLVLGAWSFAFQHLVPHFLFVCVSVCVVPNDKHFRFGHILQNKHVPMNQKMAVPPVGATSVSGRLRISL